MRDGLCHADALVVLSPHHCFHHRHVLQPEEGEPPAVSAGLEAETGATSERSGDAARP